MVVAAAASSVYAVIASWLTPSWLFLFVNLVIGTIAITSRFVSTHPRTQQQQPPPQQQRGDSPGQLARSPSLLDRLISFNLGYHKYYHPPTEEHESPVAADDPVQEKRESPRLARAPSLLDRVKSFNLGGFYKTEKQEDWSPNPGDPTRKEQTRAPSLLERLVSTKLYRSKSINEEQEPGSGSGSEPDNSGNGSAPEQLGEEEEEGVDKKADDFINRFKQQLRLQRLDSILRYRDMLKGN